MNSFYLSKDEKDLRSILFNLGSFSPSLTLRVFSMPRVRIEEDFDSNAFLFKKRFTTYFGLCLLERKVREICVVNGANGFMESLISQLAKPQLIIWIRLVFLRNELVVLVEFNCHRFCQIGEV